MINRLRHHLNKSYPLEVLAALVSILGVTVMGMAGGGNLGVLAAAISPVKLLGGQSMVITCGGRRLTLSRQNTLQVTANCVAAAAVSPTPTTGAAPTAVPGPSVAPTAMPMPTGSGAGTDGIVSTAITAESLGTCTAAVHDKYALTSSDGKKYRTWHPRKDPQTGCVFGHEHRDDPATSNIPNLQPVLFSLYDQGAEAHEGFKVSVINYGDRNDEGSTAFNSTRIVAHQGTGGNKRFTTQMHSLEIAFLGGPNGRNSGQKFFTGGMADTGGVGSICGTRVGKTVMQTDCDEQSGYEIWEFELNGMVVSWAVFDPITERRPSDNAALLLPGNKGCRHEVYAGPFDRALGTYRPLFGQLPEGLGYLATYKSGNTNEPQSQFKITRPACDFYSQIGTKN